MSALRLLLADDQHLVRGALAALLALEPALLDGMLVVGLASMAVGGALTTPGVDRPVAVLDLGGGSTDAALLTR